LLDEGATTCCYARSEKHWITDPQGVAWEHFHTLENIPVFNEAAAVPQGACCTPKQPLHPGHHRLRAAARPNPLLPIAADLRPRMTESATP
jgi:hypothetical protein